MTDQELLQAIGQAVSATMEPVRQDLHALKEDVQALREDVQTLKGDVQELQSSYTQLETKVDGIRVYVDTDLQRTLNLLLEGQKALWDRFVPQEEFEPLKDRTKIFELTVRRHSQEIRELQLA